MPAPAPAPTAPPTSVPQPETVRPSIKTPSTTPVIRVFFIILPPFCSTIRKNGSTGAGRSSQTVDVLPPQITPQFSTILFQLFLVSTELVSIIRSEERRVGQD